MPPPKRPHSPSSLSDDVFTSSRITDRQSTFIALYSPTASASTLQSHPSLTDASHRIAAWRRRSTQQRALLPGAPPPLDTGSDDDGEAKAGRRVLGVLAALRVEGAVVVGRWFGGVMLGPVRFAHIENAAREAVRQGVQAAEEGMRAREGAADGGGKRAKLEDEAEETKKRDLVEVLKTRDANTKILRGLLAEKRAALAERTKSKGPDDDEGPTAEGDSRSTPAEKEGLDKSSHSTPVQNESSSAAPPDSQPHSTQLHLTPDPLPPTTPQKTPNYSALPLPTLRRLEQARDRSIAFVLAEIARVEAELGTDGTGAVAEATEVAAGEVKTPTGQGKRDAGSF